MSWQARISFTRESGSGRIRREQRPSPTESKHVGTALKIFFRDEDSWLLQLSLENCYYTLRGPYNSIHQNFAFLPRADAQRNIDPDASLPSKSSSSLREPLTVVVIVAGRLTRQFINLFI